MKVGVVSDTHIPRVAPSLPHQLLDVLSDCQMIIHAGDLTSPAVLDELEAIAPVAAVKGNMDGPELDLPIKRVVNAGGFAIGVIHGWGPPFGLPKRVLKEFDNVQVVIFGHSHQPYCRSHGEVLLFNPGTPTDSRFSRRLTYGILKIEEHIEGTIREFI